MHSGDEHDALDLSAHIAPVAYVSAQVPGIGGVIKQRPEDFIVEEVPSYDPCGQGEHVYLYVEKRGLSTTQMVELVARHFGVPAGHVGVAGLKDRHAVTRQVVSVHVPGRQPEDFPALRHEQLSVLWVDRHTNKLRRGHLRANRFAVRIRGVPATAAITAKRTLDLLARSGVPNRAGEQRFGRLENNHLVGRAMVLGDDRGALDVMLRPGSDPGEGGSALAARRLYAEGKYVEALAVMPPGFVSEREALTALAAGQPPERAVRAIGRLQREFFVSACQSAVFNAVLDHRLTAGTVSRLLPGDLAIKHDNQAVFAVDESVAADPATADRLQRLEISPSGPIWGASMLRAGGDVDAVEVEMLRHLGIRPEDLAAYAARSGDTLPGARRALRVPLHYPDVEGGADEHGTYVKCSFELPPGAYATVVLREIIKPEQQGRTVIESKPAGSASGARREPTA